MVAKDQVALNKIMRAFMASPRDLKTNTMKTLNVYDDHDDYDREGDIKNDDFYSKFLSSDLSPNSESHL